MSHKYCLNVEIKPSMLLVLAPCKTGRCQSKEQLLEVITHIAVSLYSEKIIDTKVEYKK